MVELRYYPSNFQIWKDGKYKEISIDGLKGELSWEEWKESFEEYTEDEQKEIKLSMNIHDILKKESIAIKDVSIDEMRTADYITFRSDCFDFSLTYDIDSSLDWEEQKDAIRDFLNDYGYSVSEDTYGLVKEQLAKFGLA